jgi:hypothetical protein
LQQTQQNKQPTTNRQPPKTNNNLQIAFQMEDSSSKKLRIACGKDSSNYQMLQIACKMEGSSSKCCKWLAQWKVPAPKCPNAANSMENGHSQNKKQKAKITQAISYPFTTVRVHKCMEFWCTHIFGNSPTYAQLEGYVDFHHSPKVGYKGKIARVC